MNTKPIPIIITLAAAFISCVVSIIQGVDFSIFVARFVAVVFIFLFMGTIIKMVLDYSFKTLEPPPSIDEEAAEDGGVLEDDEENPDEENSEESFAESEEG